MPVSHGEGGGALNPSQYNRYIPLEKGEYILYNALSGAILMVDQDTKDSIDIQEKRNRLPREIVNHFKENGLIVESDEDELLLIRNKYYMRCYDPLLLAFFVAPTTRCNLSCGYCWLKAPTGKKGVPPMSVPTLKNVLCFMKKRASDLNVTDLRTTFCGGEPLIAKTIVLHMLRDLSQWSEEHSVSLVSGFHTNCTLFDQPFIDELHRYYINSVRTTVDGPQQVHDNYRYYRNGKGTYEDVISNIGLLVDEGIKVIVQYNINRHYGRAPELFDDLIERGLQNITVDCHRLYDPSSAVLEVKNAYGGLEEGVIIPQSEFTPPFKEVNEAKNYIYDWAFTKGFKLHPPKLGSLTPCNGALNYHYVIDPLGDVYKCSVSMLLKFMQVGHIHKDGNFEQYPLFYEWMDSDPTYIRECQKCDLLPSCGGGCILARKLAQRPFLCEVSPFCGEEYIERYLRQKYPEEFKSAKID